MGAHLLDGQFQSDKYPETPRGKVPLSCKDPTAQDLLWEYAQRRRAIDAEFSDDLEQALRIAGFQPPAPYTATEWNAAHPIGTEVIVTRDNGDRVQTRTRSTAWMLGCEPVVKVEGISGGYALERVRPA